ncbi:MAG: alginate lyase family protein [Woeseiaceae bacterium]
MKYGIRIAVLLLLALTGYDSLAQQERSASSGHPELILTQEGVAKIRSALGTVPLFDSSLASVKAEVDAEIAAGIDTPIPRDYSGGYTHERHKRNFIIIQKAGALYQILEDKKYARYVRDMLFQYEAMYKDLPLHPKTRSYARGKLFWQCLNDANWLVYVSQAYDAVYDYLSEAERDTLENNLLRPFADHISISNPRFFNRIHNHSTWANAAVGMIGLVMGDDELVDRALYGLSPEEFDLDPGLKDDDGGYIFDPQGRAGFLANLDEPFSPDGYHTEGPYYQRYAMYPFLVFAQGLHNVRPDLKIFEYNDGVLIKGVDAMLALSDSDGEFFPLNDGQKGMSYHTAAVVTAVNIAYLVGDNDPRLLGIAEEQGRVLLDDAGIAVATAVRDGLAEEFSKASVNLSDGSDGKQGGIAVLRDRDNELELVFKYSAQGLSHGHYDKLSWSFYEQGDEVLQDYGLARFVNIEQKGGGNYLPENSTWAKQTIAHNTLTLNESSHYGGRYEVGSAHHPDLYFYDDEQDDVQVVSATESNAYPGTTMHRTVAMIRNESFEKPIVLDVFKVRSDESNQYDLPFYFIGQLINTSFEYDAPTTLAALGSGHGYQHLYLEGKGLSETGSAKLLWMDNNRFYSLTTVTEAADELLFTRIGANDPAFNLRRDAAFTLRRNDSAGTLFVSTIETHGGYSPVTELAVNATSSIAALRVVRDDDDYTVVSVEAVDGGSMLFAIANSNSEPAANHRIELDGQELEWTGPYHYFSQR